VTHRNTSDRRLAVAVAEALESRRLLAAYLTSGTLYVDGTSGEDRIGNSINGLKWAEVIATVNGTGYRFARSAVDRVVARGFGGNDLLSEPYLDAAIPVTLNGGDGDDLFRFEDTGGRGVFLEGGAGDDEARVFTYSESSPFEFRFDGGSDTDGVFAEHGTIDLRHYPNVENGWVSEGDLHGNDLNNDLYHDADGRVYGFGGNDTIYGGHGEGTFYADGGNGNDHVSSNGHGATTLIGGTGNDVLSVGGGRATDVFDGGDGHDTLYGGGHAYGRAGNDLLWNETGVDATLDGGSGDDVIHSFADGDAGDVLRGGSGNDRLAAYHGRDTLDGGDGNDTLDGGLGADLLKGGLGTGDVLTYATRTSKVVVRLGTVADDGASGEGDNAWTDLEQVWGGAGNDVLLGTGSANVLRGNAGSDTLLGGGGADALFGGSGNDRLDGMTNNDYLEGGSGNDTLIGGTGADTLRGQDGDDWLYGRDSSRDTLVGGSGTDRAQRDRNLDYLLSIETLV
jgi:Ca2+-binding RTX toxin-like protein